MSWISAGRATKKERNSRTSSAREASSSVQRTNFSCGKAGQGKTIDYIYTYTVSVYIIYGKTYSSLRSSTKRKGWESPDRPGVESILPRHVGATFIRELL